jgi:hypothetical protein
MSQEALSFVWAQMVGVHHVFGGLSLLTSKCHVDHILQKEEGLVEEGDGALHALRRQSLPLLVRSAERDEAFAFLVGAR